MKIGDEVYVHGYIDEIRNDVIIIRNDGGYFGTVTSEVIEKDETLQNLTKPNKSDLISRQTAIDALAKEMPSLTTPDGCGEFDHDIQITDEAFVDCMQIINGLPSAQPFTAEQIQTMQELESAQVEKAYELGKADRPTGHWVDDDEQQILMKKFIEKGENWKVCNICGAGMRVGAKYDTDEQYHDFFHNYCPNCGARMEGEEG